MRFKEILESRGIAVITQYGGVRKTELGCVCDASRTQNLALRGVFWVTVDDVVADVINGLRQWSADSAERPLKGEGEEIQTQ